MCTGVLVCLFSRVLESGVHNLVLGKPRNPWGTTQSEAASETTLPKCLQHSDAHARTCSVASGINRARTQ